MSATLEEVADALRAFRFVYADEYGLQEGIARALRSRGFSVEREVRAGRGRIDLCVDRIGIEVKVAGGAREVAKQVARYLQTDDFDGLVLVSDRVRHLHVGRMIDDPRIEVVLLAGAGL